ncbi:hypothetical protein N6B72_04980 [Chryseobacterium soli]|uniref:hypothetical protein n=1 Tax=Chryseobacterium soli TaxID=445961 RepID=UPI002955D876|nr:hypothetical protein [Chryseobacterium soli]MDV7696271.1 hypothetical protein [Chryseobacterium soli]
MEKIDKLVYPQISSNTNFDQQLSEVFTELENQGLTIREYYAGQALAGLSSNMQGNSPAFIAELSVKLADLLIKQLNK